jgi:hypothetical protein
MIPIPHLLSLVDCLMTINCGEGSNTIFGGASDASSGNQSIDDINSGAGDNDKVIGCVYKYHWKFYYCSNY